MVDQGQRTLCLTSSLAQVALCAARRSYSKTSGPTRSAHTSLTRLKPLQSYDSMLTVIFPVVTWSTPFTFVQGLAQRSEDTGNWTCAPNLKRLFLSFGPKYVTDAFSRPGTPIDKPMAEFVAARCLGDAAFDVHIEFQFGSGSSNDASVMRARLETTELYKRLVAIPGNIEFKVLHVLRPKHARRGHLIDRLMAEEDALVITTMFTTTV
ncbi:hypothetical protein CYLTODRAFT_491761 [Cylindrobasidium torrendii FP15055 ss-10]|uniref:Uncharacterized protein n=1 Tax=Cylindrobasidium torrendii FP15055 ss-10 TaxID=1314674 RepID=A0A0D7B9B3_9AGAR|nr:hypothetical protein CYLTODRAFT_491761 [Cylindrobasidium torrendii FP15055 ss-10]